MKKSTLSLAVLLACLCLTSCAPVIVGRTPQPAAPEEWAFSINAGYPSNFDYPEVRIPVAQPANLFLSRGVGGNTEVNGTLFLSLDYGLRLGGKTLLVGGMVPVAIDYGMSLSLPLDIGFDAGLLLSYSQPGVEPYGALRGFVTDALGRGYISSVAGALTIGADIPAGSGNFFVEVTAHTSTTAYAPLPPFGFAIVPALGYRF